MLGVCNGFQTLVKAGILPGPMSKGQTVTLTNNDSGRFECRWVYLSANPKSKCVFTQRHRAHLRAGGPRRGQAGSRTRGDRSWTWRSTIQTRRGRKHAGYPHNPNGSLKDIAGITDATGRIFGLMPHPEDHIRATQHPRWTRGEAAESSLGSAIYKNAVDWVKSL